MPIFQSLANILKSLAVGERVKITARPETGLFPNPIEGEVMQKTKPETCRCNRPAALFDSAPPISFRLRA